MVGGTLLPGAVTLKVSVRHWVFWVTGVPAAEKFQRKIRASSHMKTK